MCVRTGPQCSPAVRSKGLIHESAPHDRDQTEDAREVQRLVSAMAFGSQGGGGFLCVCQCGSTALQVHARRGSRMLRLCIQLHDVARAFLSSRFD